MESYGSAEAFEPKKQKVWPYVVLSFVLLACVLGYFAFSAVIRYRPVANDLAADFHKQFESEKYDEIYLASGADLKKSATKEDFSKLMLLVHEKLGNPKGTSQTYLQVNATMGGKFLRADFDTQFEKAAGKETFVWHLDGDHRELYSYHVTSPALVTKVSARVIYIHVATRNLSRCYYAVLS